MTARQEELIAQIKDRLLKNAIAEYDNGIEDCNDIVSRDRSKYQKENYRLFEERVFLMQDYEDILYEPNLNEEELNFKYER